ncbi:MAG: O-antigen ligase family protein [Chitinophagaceae bacterium]
MLVSSILLIITIALLIKKQEWLLLLFFTLTISAINFDLPLGNIRYRPLLAILLVARSFFTPGLDTFRMLGNTGMKWIFLFFLYIIMLSWGNDTLKPDIFRLIMLSVITAYLGCYAYTIRENTAILETAILLSGMICFSDLLYTYKIIGNFPVQRLYYLFLPNSSILEEINDTNHNFYGFICGIGFVLLFSRFIWDGDRWSNYVFLLLPLLFLGVLMSTSRSTIFGLIVASSIILYIGSRNPILSGKVYTTLGIMGVIIGGILFLFLSLSSFLDLDYSFISNITYRLVEEPVAVIRKYMGLSYNVQNLDAMDWRKESASIAWEAYLRFPIRDQLMGVGIGGYLQRNLGQNGLNPHNGLLYILVESGLIGFIMYLYIFIQAIFSGIRSNFSPLFLVLFFILFYSFGQNEELISATAMLFISTLIANSSFNLLHNE